MHSSNTFKRFLDHILQPPVHNASSKQVNLHFVLHKLSAMHFLPALIPLRSVCVSTFSGFKEIPIVKTMFPECLVRSFEASPGTLRREVSKIFALLMAA